MNRIRCLNCDRVFPSPGSFAHPAHLCARTTKPTEHERLAKIIPLFRKEQS
jgi:hypothetical protein